MAKEKSFIVPNDLLGSGNSGAWIIASNVVQAAYELRGQTAVSADERRQTVAESAGALMEATRNLCGFEPEEDVNPADLEETHWADDYDAFDQVKAGDSHVFAAVKAVELLQLKAAEGMAEFFEPNPAPVVVS
jgi:hypothetical protein